MDSWPTIKCERFDGEREEFYRRRAARIVEIVTGFRNGRFGGELAEQMERELVRLQNPILVLEPA